MRSIRLTVLALSIAWCVAMVAVPGRFPQGDEAIFKEPGYQLAGGGKWAAPPFEGFFALSPDISETFAVYQPLYSLGYAGWLAFFPHTFRSSVAYDAVIHLALVVAIMFGLPRIMPGLKAEWAAVIAGTYNLMGTAGRPDGLAMMLGYWGLALWFAGGQAGGTVRRAVLAGLFLGLAGATSLPALLILLMWAGVLWLSLAMKGAADVKRTAIVVLVAAGSALAILVPFYLRTGALTQYLQHAQWFTFAGLARSVRAGSLEPFADLVIAGFRTNIYMYPLIGLLLAAGAAGALIPGRGMRAAYFGVLLVYAFILLCLPQQTYYYWFLIPIAAACAVTAFNGPAVRVALLAGATVVGGNRVCRDFVKTCALPPGQSLAAAEKALMDHVPRDSRLAVNPASYFAARRLYPHLYVKRQEMPDLLSEVDYCAWSSWWLREVDGVMIPAGMFSREEVRQLKTEFTEISNNLPATPPRFLGIPLGREPRGFGMVIYRRRSATNAPHR